MKGFIKKDIAMVKNNFKLLALLIFFYAVMGISGGTDISFILPFLSVMIMISTFSYDEFNNWGAYSVTFPNGRKNSVTSKYVATILLILSVSIITTILSIIISYINTNSVDFLMIFLNIISTIFATLLVLSFMYPIIFKFGIEKARIGIFAVIIAVVIIGGLLLKFVDLSFVGESLNFLGNYLLLIIVLIGIILVYLSYKISLKIALKKEY